LTPRLGTPTRASRTRSGAGGWRRDGARPERARGGAHGDKEEAASLTGGGAGEERQQRGGGGNGDLGLGFEGERGQAGRG